MRALEKPQEITSAFKSVNPLFEACPCPMCKRFSVASVLATFGEIKVVRCECDFVYQSSRLTEEAMKSCYEDNSYYSGEGAGYSDYAAQEVALRMTFRKFLENIAARGHAGGKLLEVGCGYGFLLDEAKDYYSVRWGTEYNPEAVHKAQQSADRIIAGGLEELEQFSEKFDCVILNQVIEHIYDPKAFTKELLSFVSPGGVVVMATPNVKSSIRYLMGKKWPSYKIPEHISYFENKTLSRLLSESGFINVQMLPYPHAFPLSLLASKFGIRVPDSIGSHGLWIPGTTVCCMAERPAM